MPGGNWKLLIGDVRERLRDIPAGTVQTCITSPPYWGLRDYQVAGQIGSEPTPEEFIATMVGVFRLVRDTLRDDGSLWLNLGCSYATSGSQLLMPHRVAMALQADGWILRSTVIWSKRSPMPESLSGWRWVPCRVKNGRQVVTEGGLSSWDMGEHSHGPASGEYRGQEKTVAKWEPCPGCERTATRIVRSSWNHTGWNL